MADPLSNLQSTETMEHDPDTAVQEALKTRKHKRVPANIAPSNIPPSKLASFLGAEMLKRALSSDPQTSAKYGPAALAGIKTSKPTGKMSTGNGWGSMQGTTSPTAAPGIAKMAGPPDSLGPDIMAKLKAYMPQGLQPWASTLARRLGSAGSVGALGAIGGGLIGGVKGMFDEKDDDENRLMHALRGAGGGALMGGGAGIAGGLAVPYGADLAGLAKNKLHEVTTPSTAKPIRYLAGESTADKIAALHYPALCKAAVGSPTGGPMGMGPGSAGMAMGGGMSGAMGGAGAAPGGGGLARAPGGIAGGTIGAGGMPPPATPGAPGAPPAVKGPAAGGMLASGGGQMGGLKMK